MRTAAVPPRTLRLGEHHYPLVLPSIRDPRLHLAAAIISIHILGQTVLGFHVSVVQILVAILTCAVIEVTWTFHQTGTLVWPASAMLTGSGVALIFRVIGTENGDYWSWHGWYLFAIVAGLSLVTKYVIRHRGSHVFNPSNVGLVAAFIILGSTRVEPLDFWWAPFSVWMAITYLIIIVGGVLITRRLHLLAMSVAFWITLAVGLGVVAASGHCMTAHWAFEPVCGSRFWWTIVTSPEILIFLFFMITDPKTVPAGRVARLVFAAGVAVVSTVLIAPQTTEFGAKVGLLAGLVVLCAVRLPVERFFPAANSDQDRLGAFALRLTVAGSPTVVPRRAFTRGAIGGSAAVFLVAGIVAAGAASRGIPQAPRAEVFPVITAEIDPSTLPGVTVDADVSKSNSDLTGSGAQAIGVSLAEDLATETQALLAADKSLLPAVAFGDHLSEMQQRIDEAVSTGRTVVANYRFESLRIASVIRSPGQIGLSLGFDARGTLEEVTYDADGDQTDRTASPFALTFVLSRPTGGRWMIVATLPLR
ncbi:MAG: hypothetical protein ABI595_13870 [Actinomycetota bacterium]